jgi:hypothetical protein
MKNKLILIMFLLSLICILGNLGFVSADITSCSPNITLINQDPYPAIPNSYVTLVFEVSRLENCNGFAIKINQKYPFSLDPGVDPIQTIYKPDSTDYKDSWIVPYKLRVAQDALDDDYNIILNYHIGNSKDFSGYSFEQGFNVSLKDSQTFFDVVVQEATSSEVSIAIANVGKYTANSVVVRIPNQEDYSVTGTDGQMIGNLASGDYTLVGFSIAKKAKSSQQTTTTRTGNYDMPSGEPTSRVTNSTFKLDIYYTDNIGERRVINMGVPLNIAGNSSAMARLTRTTTSAWYTSWTNWIIIFVILIIIYFIYGRYSEQIKNGLFSKKKKATNSKTPDWVTNAKEKEKKK